MEVELQLRPQSVEPDLSQSSALSSAHAVESQFGRSVQLFQFKPNTHPSIQIKYPSFSFESLSSLFSKLTKDRCSNAIEFVLNLGVYVSCFLFNLKWKRQRYEKRRHSFELSWVFNWNVLSEELSAGSTTIHNLGEKRRSPSPAAGSALLFDALLHSPTSTESLVDL